MILRNILTLWTFFINKVHD